MPSYLARRHLLLTCHARPPALSLCEPEDPVSCYSEAAIPLSAAGTGFRHKLRSVSAKFPLAMADLAKAKCQSNDPQNEAVCSQQTWRAQ
jgi:hypothetical protein